MVAERLIGDADISTTDDIAATARQLGWSFQTNASGKKVTRAFVKLTRSAGVVDTETFSFGAPGVGDQSDGGTYYTLGCEFTPSQDGYVSGVDWRCSNVGPAGVQQAGLWTKADKGLVASSNTLVCTPASINRILFTSVYRVTAGVTYVVGVLTNRYAYTAGPFPGFTTTHLTAPTGVNGRFDDTVAGVMVYPDNINSGGANYHVSPVYDRESTFVSGTKWQLWKRASPISTSTLLQSIEIGGGVIAGIGFTWKQVPGITQSSLVQNDPYFTTIFMPSSDPGKYLYRSGFGNPTSGSLSGSNIYKNGGTATDPPDDETFTDGAFAVDIEIDDASGSFQVIGQVTESGTVFPVAKRKIFSLNFATETGTVHTPTRVKAKSIAQTVESGTVFDVDAVKFRTVGQVTESGVVFDVDAVKAKTVGQVIEGGSVFSVSSAQIVSAEIGQVLEFGSPGRLGIAPEVDTHIVMEVGRTEIEIEF